MYSIYVIYCKCTFVAVCVFCHCLKFLRVRQLLSSVDMKAKIFIIFFSIQLFSMIDLGVGCGFIAMKGKTILFCSSKERVKRIFFFSYNRSKSSLTFSIIVHPQPCIIVLDHLRKRVHSVEFYVIKMLIVHCVFALTLFWR